jgi:hypothetical protein
LWAFSTLTAVSATQSSILHRFCIDFEGFAGVLSALFTDFGPLRSRQDAAVAPQLSAALFGFF